MKDTHITKTIFPYENKANKKVRNLPEYGYSKQSLLINFCTCLQPPCRSIFIIPEENGNEVLPKPCGEK
jgi:hypothetical protein